MAVVAFIETTLGSKQSMFNIQRRPSSFLIICASTISSSTPSKYIELISFFRAAQECEREQPSSDLCSSPTQWCTSHPTPLDVNEPRQRHTSAISIWVSATSNAIHIVHTHAHTVRQLHTNAHYFGISRQTTWLYIFHASPKWWSRSPLNAAPNFPTTPSKYVVNIHSRNATPKHIKCKVISFGTFLLRW